MVWRLLTAPDEFLPTKDCIIDNDVGIIYIDKDYAALGVEEGWLFRDGWFTGPDNILVWTYRQRTL